MLKLFLDGKIVLEWLLRQETCVPGDETSPPHDGDPSATQTRFVRAFAHVSLLYVRPWRATGVALGPADESTLMDIRVSESDVTTAPSTAYLARKWLLKARVGDDGTLAVFTPTHIRGLAPSASTL